MRTHVHYIKVKCQCSDALCSDHEKNMQHMHIDRDANKKQKDERLRDCRSTEDRKILPLVKKCFSAGI